MSKSPPDKIRVLLIEDDAAEALRLQGLIDSEPRSEFIVSGKGSRIDEAITAIGHAGVDLILLDLTLPDAAGD
jgi:CheY-like chemotaxis protein